VKLGQRQHNGHLVLKNTILGLSYHIPVVKALLLSIHLQSSVVRHRHAATLLVPAFDSVRLFRMFRWKQMCTSLFSLKKSASRLSSMHHQTSWDLFYRNIIKITHV
jgi:hypothetical protein